MFDTLHGLLRINISARTLGFPAPILERVERAIDTLKGILPEANENFPSNSLTWEINKAATEYLPHLVHRVAALSSEQREAMSTEIATALDDLNAALDRAQEAMYTQKADQMSVAARFISARFNDAAF